MTTSKPTVEGDELAPLVEWSFEGLIDEFVHIHSAMPDRKYAFVLGAGASKSSGILSGGDLVDRWLRELKLRDPVPTNLGVEEWATAKRLSITNFTFENRARFYPEIYARRFAVDPESGYAYLESVMQGAAPSFGYIALAHILSQERHKVVITTNFDNLVADALTIYTDTYPLVCGHEALANFVVPTPRRPIVAKVHRDLLLAPLSDPAELASLKEGWTRVLRSILTHYTPLIVGYGGNDGSLFALLDTLAGESRVGPLVWCHHGDLPVEERVEALIRKSKGVLVRIPDFDTLMLLLTTRLKYTSLADRLVKQTDRRIESFNKQLTALQARLNERAGSAPSSHAALAQTAIAEVSDQALLSQQRAASEDPTNVPALVALASTHIARDEWEPAERVLLKLLELQTRANHTTGIATTRSNLGRIYRGMQRLEDARAQLSIARALNREAGSRVGEAIVASQLAQLALDQGQHEEARSAFQEALDVYQAIEVDEGAMFCASNLGKLAREARRHAEAIAYFRTAADAASRLGRRREQGWNLGNLASVYRDIGDLAQARQCYEDALELAEEADDETGRAITLDNLGVVAAKQGDLARAEGLFRRAAMVDEKARKPVPAAMHRINLGIVEWRLKRESAARKNWETAFTILRGSDSPLAARVKWQSASELEAKLAAAPSAFMPFI